MKILLPPSETKRPGGSGASLDLEALALPSLRSRREEAVDALVRLSADEDEAARVLKLSARQREAVQDNARLRTAGCMPAVDRYTGVLFDALDAPSLPSAARRWLGAHVWIHSAPFGPVGALDRIPSYRLGAGVSVPGLAPLTRHWASSVTEAIRVASPSFVLDLRSEAYVALGPVPTEAASAYVRVVTEGGRALNHFNKHAKGALVRALAEDRPRASSRKGLLAWAAGSGIDLRETADRSVLELVTEQPVAKR
ncbi:YaaA family protein [Microbacterium resistens]|uniref:YaaA family protein n=1 Tax=Microbacterium resistens TaxID=156977 RepID=UPI003672D98B